MYGFKALIDHFLYMFKERSSKKRTIATDGSANRATTLDARHQYMITQMTQNRTQIDILQKELEDLTIKQRSIKNNIDEKQQHDDYDTEEYNELWDNYLKLSDKIRELNQNLKSLELNTDEIEYFENTANILYDYYNLIECQDTEPITVVAPPVKTIKGRKKITHPPNRSILEAFNKWTNNESTEESIVQNTEINETPSIDIQQPQQVPKQKSSLVDAYLSLIEPMHISTLEADSTSEQCRFCSTILTHLHQDGIMICTNCGNQEQLLVEQNRPVHRQTSKEANHFSYKRINHLNEWICQVQGKESTDIPEEVFDKILAEIKKERIDPMKLTYNKMREILKKIKINKYYEHIPYIINRITGLPTPHFPPELEAKLRSMFNETQAPFLKHCPASRVNYLSYSFVLYKFFQLLGRHEFLKYFPLLKSREKLHEQDVIWSKVCKELNWPFFPSM